MKEGKDGGMIKNKGKEKEWKNNRTKERRHKGGKKGRKGKEELNKKLNDKKRSEVRKVGV